MRPVFSPFSRLCCIFTHICCQLANFQQKPWPLRFVSSWQLWSHDEQREARQHQQGGPGQSHAGHHHQQHRLHRTHVCGQRGTQPAEGWVKAAADRKQAKRHKLRYPNGVRWPLFTKSVNKTSIGNVETRVEATRGRRRVWGGKKAKQGIALVAHTHTHTVWVKMRVKGIVEFSLIQLLLEEDWDGYSVTRWRIFLPFSGSLAFHSRSKTSNSSKTSFRISCQQLIIKCIIQINSIIRQFLQYNSFNNLIYNQRYLFFNIQTKEVKFLI